MKAMAKIPAVTSAMGTPCMDRGMVLELEPFADTREEHQRRRIRWP